MSLHQRTDNLLLLPKEIQRRIISCTIPSNDVIRIKSFPEDLDVHKIYSEWEGVYSSRVLLEWLIHTDFEVNAIGLLLLHKSLTEHVLELLYTKNVFAFADYRTFELFSHQISSFARERVRKIFISASGRLMRIHHRDPFRLEEFFEHCPDYRILDMIQLYPSLSELQLEGIGPGRMPCHHRGRPGQCYGDGDDYQTWEADALEIVGSIIGSDLTGFCDEMYEQSTGHINQLGVNSLTAGTVISSLILRLAPSGFPMPGVRIVAHRKPFSLEMVEHVVDLDRAIAKATTYADRYEWAHRARWYFRNGQRNSDVARWHYPAEYDESVVLSEV